MGFISRNFLPACENVCLCCPALKPSSRRPVKRYKKMLSEIFPKKLDGSPNERKIMKLCEYASKNPARIPKIARFLQQKCYKELRSENFGFIKIIMEVYCKLLSVCKDQMVYFAMNLLSVIVELLDARRLDELRILGCQTLTALVYCQSDSTYARNIGILIPKVGNLARETHEGNDNVLQAACLQCLSSMVWFMSEYSYVFPELDQIVYAILENYETDEQPVDAGKRCESHHNWVDEVVRCEAGAGAILHDTTNDMILRYFPESKDSTLLTREERENPKVWSQICIQKLAALAKESTTMRWVLDPMFTYFDVHEHWRPKHGLALNVLLDMVCLSKISGNEQFILVSLVRHLDHKNIIHDPQLKSSIVHIATSLVKQLRLSSVAVDIGVASNLCRHLRKSLQVTAEIAGAEEVSWNFLLQGSIEDCLLEIAKGIGDVSPLYEMMTIMLEKLSSIAVVARSTIGSLLIVAHIIFLTSVRTHVELMFPEALLVQLIKAMLHPDAEVRVGSHMIFAIILAGTPIRPRYESEYPFESKKLHSRTAAAFASATALLEKLQREYQNRDKNRNTTQDEPDAKVHEDNCKNGWLHKSSPYFHKLSCSIIDKTSIWNFSTEAETNFIKLNEDQLALLLSAFWRQAQQADTLPANFEAIALSFCLALVSSHLKNPNHSAAAWIFQLLLSLKNESLDPNGALPPPSRRSLFTLAVSLLGFTGKFYQIPELVDSLWILMSCHVDPYLRVGDDLLLYTRHESNLLDYGSKHDEEVSIASLAESRKKMAELDPLLVSAIGQHLSRFTNMHENDMVKVHSETFNPDVGALLEPVTFVKWDAIQTIKIVEESLSFEEEHMESLSVDDDETAGHLPSNDIPRSLSWKPAPPSGTQFVNVNKLLESALHVAGQVAGASVATSPLPYGTVASQCEAFSMVMRRKLSTWLVTGDNFAPHKTLQAIHACSTSAIGEVCSYKSKLEAVQETWQAMRLPPASPFDNFMKAAGF